MTIKQLAILFFFVIYLSIVMIIFTDAQVEDYCTGGYDLTGIVQLYDEAETPEEASTAMQMLYLASGGLATSIEVVELEDMEVYYGATVSGYYSVFIESEGKPLCYMLFRDNPIESDI